jgi:NADH-quinone oxidoreductase subunit M
MLLAAVGLKAGLYGLLRVSVGILPDGSRWAATTLALAGVVTIAFGALSLWRSQALSDIIGSVIVGELGFCFLGVGAMTREGFAGCLFQMVSHGLLVGVVFVVSGAAGAPATATDAPRVSSSATVWGIALGALVGMPGLPGFWGEIVPILGAFPVARALAVLALLGALATVVLQVRALRTVPMPTLALRGRDIAAILPLALFAIALGLCPGPFFTLVQGGVSDTNQLVNPPGPDEIALAN